MRPDCTPAGRFCHGACRRIRERGFRRNLSEAWTTNPLIAKRAMGEASEVFWATHQAKLVRVHPWILDGGERPAPAGQRKGRGVRKIGSRRCGQGSNQYIPFRLLNRLIRSLV